MWCLWFVIRVNMLFVALFIAWLSPSITSMDAIQWTFEFLANTWIGQFVDGLDTWVQYLWSLNDGHDLSPMGFIQLLFPCLIMLIDLVICVFAEWFGLGWVIKKFKVKKFVKTSIDDANDIDAIFDNITICMEQLNNNK